MNHKNCILLKILNYVTFCTDITVIWPLIPVEIFWSTITGSAANMIGFLDMPTLDNITFDM